MACKLYQIAPNPEFVHCRFIEATVVEPFMPEKFLLHGVQPAFSMVTLLTQPSVDCINASIFALTEYDRNYISAVLLATEDTVYDFTSISKQIQTDLLSSVFNLLMASLLCILIGSHIPTKMLNTDWSKITIQPSYSVWLGPCM